MPSLIRHLSEIQQKILFKNLNYMNMQELKNFCNKHQIPYFICYEDKDGAVRQTRALDRKSIILDRIKFFLKTGHIKKTIFPKLVVSFDRLPSKLEAKHPVLYGQYKNGDKKILSVLKQHTDGAFEFGAIAQEVIRECWSQGLAPTYKEFAKKWKKAQEAHTQPNPEWTFLADKRQGVAGPDWKKLRIENAKAALEVLDSIEYPVYQKSKKIK